MAVSSPVSVAATSSRMKVVLWILVVGVVAGSSGEEGFHPIAPPPGLQQPVAQQLQQPAMSSLAPATSEQQPRAERLRQPNEDHSELTPRSALRQEDSGTPGLLPPGQSLSSYYSPLQQQQHYYRQYSPLQHKVTNYVEYEPLEVHEEYIPLEALVGSQQEKMRLQQIPQVFYRPLQQQQLQQQQYQQQQQQYQQPRQQQQLFQQQRPEEEQSYYPDASKRITKSSQNFMAPLEQVPGHLPPVQPVITRPVLRIIRYLPADV